MQSAIAKRMGSSSLMKSQTSWRRAWFLAATLSSPHSRASGFSVGSVSNSASDNHLHRCGCRRWMSSGDDGNPKRDLNPRAHILSRSPKEDHGVLETTLDWVEKVVIGMNFCPFAEKPMLQKRLHLEVVNGTDQVDILARVLAECFVRRDQPGTSLMICPHLFPNDFHKFLEVYNMLQDGVLVDNELTDDIQVAPFHPMFQFDGSGEDGVDNYTNRSPYPIFHVIREAEVSQAVDALQGDASKVWRRNIQLLEELDDNFDREQVEELMTGRVLDPDLKERAKAILQRIKKEFN